MTTKKTGNSKRDSLSIAITGANGRMGQALISEALDTLDSIQLAGAVHRSKSDCIGRDLGLHVGRNSIGVAISDDITQLPFEVLIDFSLPEPSLNYLASCVELARPIVIGTTGFNEDQLEAIRSASSIIPIVLAANMSVGVTLCFHLLSQMARVMGDDADIEIIETHHRNKVDAPSGTALKMGEIIAGELGRDLAATAVHGRHDVGVKRSRDEIGFSSVRAGDVVGDHTVLFATHGERIELTHKASSRATFAKGAMRAALWLKHQPPGLYDMQDVLNLR